MTTQPPTTSTTTIRQTTTTVRPPRAFYQRQCGSRISEGYGAQGADIPILHIGPVALLAFDPEWLATKVEEYSTPNAEGRYQPIKYVLVVNHEAVGPVSVSIPAPDRDHLRLAYDPALSHPYPMWQEADHTVKFGVCSDVDAQYNGGIVISGPICAQIVVVDEGVEGSEWTASIPIGGPVAGCPSQ
jgi:hypothetical protein